MANCLTSEIVLERDMLGVYGDKQDLDCVRIVFAQLIKNKCLLLLLLYNILLPDPTYITYNSTELTTKPATIKTQR